MSGAEILQTPSSGSYIVEQRKNQMDISNPFLLKVTNENGPSGNLVKFRGKEDGYPFYFLISDHSGRQRKKIPTSSEQQYIFFLHGFDNDTVNVRCA